MAITIATSITINASPARVWEVLTDFASYPEWNPFVTRANGNFAVGERVAITVGGMDFKPVVLVYEPERELRWLGRLLLPGVFNGEHYFLLAATEDGSTELTHGEKFTGLLPPLLRKKLETDTRQGFVAMNEALKKLVEG